MEDPVRIPRELFTRLMAAIETPDDLTEDERRELLEDADRHYPYSVEDEEETPDSP